jgi:hypothetical protein
VTARRTPAARAAGRERWRKWAKLRRAKKATARFEYDGPILGRLIVAEWLAPSDAPTPDEIGRAVSNFFAHVDPLPKKKC